MNQFHYQNISDEEFEDLVIRICNEILGISCKTFSVGKDGAKDSWFTGTAERYPSSVRPWSEIFIIIYQAVTFNGNRFILSMNPRDLYGFSEQYFFNCIRFCKRGENCYCKMFRRRD